MTDGIIRKSNLLMKPIHKDQQLMKKRNNILTLFSEISEYSGSSKSESLIFLQNAIMPYFVKIEKTSEAVEQEFLNFYFMVSEAISGFCRSAKCKRGVGISPPSDFDIRSIAGIYAC